MCRLLHTSLPCLSPSTFCRGKVALALTRLVLDVRCPLLGDFHPLTIETQYLQVRFGREGQWN